MYCSNMIRDPLSVYLNCVTGFIRTHTACSGGIT